MKCSFTFVFAFLFTFLAANAQNDVLGLWKHTNDEYIIKISQVGNSLHGRIVWLKNETDSEGEPVLDSKNPNEKMRRLPVKGNKVLSGYTYNNSTGMWEDGKFYDFTNGKIYKSNIKSSNDRLELILESNGDKVVLTKAD